MPLLSNINLNAKAEPKASPSGLIWPVIKLEESLMSSKSLLIANERSVELGIRRRLDVLISQQQLISVQKDLAIARFELISAWLSLNYHAGLNLDKEIQVINGFLLR